jgi:KDO2-lipid IV(A) lauroyltransferase
MLEAAAAASAGAKNAGRRALEALRHDGVFWRRLAYLGTAHGPWWWRRYTPAAFGALWCALLKGQRQIVADNLIRMNLAESPLDAWLGAQRMFIQFAESLTDGLESVAKGLDGYELDSPTDRSFKDALARGRGVILLTAHTGSWEVVGRLIGKKHRAPVTMVMTREQNLSTRAFADALRTQKNEGDFELAYVGTDPLAALPLVAALRRNRVVALQFDRVPPGMASISVPFFGWLQPFPVGPFKLGQVTGAPIVIALTRRTGHRRYAVEIPEVFTIDRAGGEAALTETVTRVARAVEDFVRRHPAQWFHFERLSRVPASSASEELRARARVAG